MQTLEWGRPHFTDQTTNRIMGRNAEPDALSIKAAKDYMMFWRLL